MVYVSKLHATRRVTCYVWCCDLKSSVGQGCTFLTGLPTWNIKHVRKEGYFGLSLLHSRRLRLCILSVRFLLSSSSSQGSKIRSNFKQAQMTKVTVSMCWHGTNIKKFYGDLFDIWWRVKGQRKVKSKTTSNGKSNSVNMLTLDRHPKLSTVTSSSDLR